MDQVVVFLLQRFQNENIALATTPYMLESLQGSQVRFDFIGIYYRNLINMNEDSETFDNYPIINSFLTTIHQNSPPPTQKEFSPQETVQPITKQLDDWFEAQSKAIQIKKQRELMKQNRLKKLQEEFEQQRIRKQKQMDEKLVSTEKNKNKNLVSLQQKLHKISLRHNKVYTKIQDEHLKELQKQYDCRKAYQIETSRRSARLISTSQQSSSSSRHRSIQDSKSKTLEQEETFNKINEITQRLEKAKTMYKERQDETANKARNHNVFDLYQVQSKAKEHYDDYLRLYATKILTKMENADLNKDKIEKNLEKKNEERQKAYTQKLKRIQTNLIQLQEQQEQKFQELSKKLVSHLLTQQKTSSSGKGEREHRETLYHQRFLNNLEQLEREKISRADQIIQKHQEISLKNRLFKEKKQTLYRHLKVEGQ